MFAKNGRLPKGSALTLASEVFVELLTFTIFTTNRQLPSVDQVIDQTAELKDDAGIYDALGCHEEAQRATLSMLCLAWFVQASRMWMMFWVRNVGETHENCHEIISRKRR